MVFQKPPVVGTQDTATTGGHDQVPLTSQLLEHVGLPGSEPCLALNLEDSVHLDATAGLDGFIGVNEPKPPALGQCTPHRRFARSHRANEEQLCGYACHCRADFEWFLATIAGMWRFSIVFVVLILALFTIEVLQPVQDHVILPFTAGIANVSVFLIELFDDGVISAGKVIRDAQSGFAVSIEPGCNGVEALIILFAAIFAFPAPLKHKLIGFGIGFVAIQSLNLVRIISLFYMGQWSMTWFNWFHLYLWQALIILDALVVWLIWLRMLPATPSKNNDGNAPAGAVSG